jgi:hypothetical protein
MDKHERYEQLRSDIRRLRHHSFPYETSSRQYDLQVWEIAWREQEVRRLREELEAS